MLFPVQISKSCSRAEQCPQRDQMGLIRHNTKGSIVSTKRDSPDLARDLFRLRGSQNRGVHAHIVRHQVVARPSRIPKSSPNVLNSSSLSSVLDRSTAVPPNSLRYETKILGLAGRLLLVKFGCYLFTGTYRFWGPRGLEATCLSSAAGSGAESRLHSESLTVPPARRNASWSISLQIIVVAMPSS